MLQTENGDTVVVTATRPGEFVVCNLASLSLGNLPVEDEAYMERTVETAIRALDNVIDLNFYPLEYARLTNHKYRSIGLGVSGYHHMLAKRGIRWESEEHTVLTGIMDLVLDHLPDQPEVLLHFSLLGLCKRHDASPPLHGRNPAGCCFLRRSRSFLLSAMTSLQ